MERREPLRRKTPLKQTGNQLKRTAITPRPIDYANQQAMRGGGLKRSKPKRRARMPGTIAREVEKRSRGRCIVCGKRPRQPTRHHVLPVRDWPELELVAANMVLVCWDPCHANHEAAHRRIRWEELPECAIALAYSTSGAAAVYMERTYPRRTA